MSPAAPDIRTAVTWLFVPAIRPERFARAVRTGADAVVVDLEDAVAPGERAGARHGMRAAWPEAPGTALVVRVNAYGTPDFADDAALCRELAPAAVVLPKTESAEHVRAAAEATGAPVLALVESARGLIALPEITGAPAVVRLLLGGIDLSLDLGVSDDAALDTARADLVRWSAARGLPAPVDGVTADVRDAAAASGDARRAAAWGFGGKLCVHPSQVGPVREAFRPGARQTEWARRVLAAAATADGGATTAGGEMIDRPVIERARRILHSAE